MVVLPIIMKSLGERNADGYCQRYWFKIQVCHGRNATQIQL